ncbi:hypothetical protein BLNAU_7068 [Blattamonas nauphoetae]|uniref:Uncharacterized protein n=1 Tax=Blattamonas nauphoetae TaxID=2049346 RepID=A0ABQ9Y2B6_9EUKA|nr:hypothetical protein BLNAU_7068 [Blattamonas nauphoetae]
MDTTVDHHHITQAAYVTTGMAFPAVARLINQDRCHHRYRTPSATATPPPPLQPPSQPPHHPSLPSLLVHPPNQLADSIQSAPSSPPLTTYERNFSPLAVIRRTCSENVEDRNKPSPVSTTQKQGTNPGVGGVRAISVDGGPFFEVDKKTSFLRVSQNRFRIEVGDTLLKSSEDLPGILALFNPPEPLVALHPKAKSWDRPRVTRSFIARPYNIIARQNCQMINPEATSQTSYALVRIDFKEDLKGDVDLKDPPAPGLTGLTFSDRASLLLRDDVPKEHKQEHEELVRKTLTRSVTVLIERTRDSIAAFVQLWEEKFSKTG